MTRLAACYKQLNSSVGEFGTATLQAATKAIESTSLGDHVYSSVDRALTLLGQARDRLAGQVKRELQAAADGVPIRGARPIAWRAPSSAGAWSPRRRHR